MMPAKLLLLALAAAQLAAAPAAARKDESPSKREQKMRDHDYARQALLRGEVLPLPRILAFATKYQAGEMLEVELKSRDRVLIYDVHVLTANGSVRELLIDARNGKLIANNLKND